jgi:hypothetical protein
MLHDWILQKIIILHLFMLHLTALPVYSVERNDWWMVTWKWCGKKRSQHNLGKSSGSAVRDWGNKISVRLIGVPAESRSRQLPNTDKKHYRFRQHDSVTKYCVEDYIKEDKLVRTCRMPRRHARRPCICSFIPKSSRKETISESQG